MIEAQRLDHNVDAAYMQAVYYILDLIFVICACSFVQELVASPMDGVSLLLEVLRAIQLSQSSNASGGAGSGNGGLTTTAAASAMMMRNNQSYQRRALLDELACL